MTTSTVVIQIQVEHKVQSLLKDHQYKKVINTSDSFNKSMKKLNGSGSIEGSYNSEIFNVELFKASGKLAAEFSDIAKDVSHLKNSTNVETMNLQEFQPGFSQIVRVVKKTITIDGISASKTETEIVDRLPNNMQTNVKDLTNRSVEYINQYKNGSGKIQTNGTICTFSETERKKIATKEWFRVRNKHSGLVLDISGGKKGGKLVIWRMHEGNNQLWKWNGRGGLVSKTGFVLDVQGGKAASGTNAIGWDWNGTGNQKWKYEGGKIISLLNSMVLDVRGDSKKEGTEVILWESKKKNDDNQRWTFE